ncbi:MAG: response regulator, partial [Gammaproteobacteria bacterium]
MSQNDKQNTRILIIEDEALFAKAVKKRLEVAGYHPEVAGSLSIAHDSIDSFSPDLVLLDMRLPDGSGLNFLRELREEKNSNVPVLVLSAYGELEDAVAAMKLDASDYLKKPIDLDELLLNVEKVLNQEKISRQLEYSRKR